MNVNVFASSLSRVIGAVLLPSAVIGCGTATPVATQIAPATTTTTPYVAATPPTVSVAISGPVEVVYNYSTQACANGDIPDMGARAFRDARGNVHLIASNNINRGMVGTSLNTVQKVCNIIYQDDMSADPSTFDDAGWLESFYTLDGQTIYGYASLDYHPYRHNLPCASSPADTADTDYCWYSTIIQANSTDGGNTFVSPAPGVARFVAGSSYVFSPTHTATTGALIPTNIVSMNGAYYMLVGMAGDRAQTGGDCLFRTTNLADPTSWRAWDGVGFNIQSVDPFTTANVNPAAHACTPVSPSALQWYARSLVALPNGAGYIVSMAGTTLNASNQSQDTVMISTSADLITWSTPVPLINLVGDGATACAANPFGYFYAYPSILDPNSTSMNFNTVGSSAYLYVTRFDGCPTTVRDLVRYPFTISVN